MFWTAKEEASPMLWTLLLILSFILSDDLKLVPSSIINKFSPVIPLKSTFAPFGVAIKTAEAFPLSSPILFDILLPVLRFKIASVSARIFPETLVANYERAISPGASNVMPSTTDGDFMLLGWSSALNRWKSRNPIFNDEIPPLLNFWGEEVTVGTGKTTWEYWTPFQIKNQKYNNISDILIKNFLKEIKN